MKKNIKRLFSAVICLALVMSMMIFPSAEERIRGDVNLDGELSNVDLVQTARYLVNITEPGSMEYWFAQDYGDMNLDGTVDNADLVQMARTVVGLEEPIIYEEGIKAAVLCSEAESPVTEYIIQALRELNVTFINYCCDGDSNTQLDQIDSAIARRANVLIVELADAENDEVSRSVCDKAQFNDVPVIFYHNELTDSVLKTYDNACFVGPRMEDAGKAQGHAAARYLLQNYSAVDLNGDGRISYVIFSGEEGSEDANWRTAYAPEYCDLLLLANNRPGLAFYDGDNGRGCLEADWSREKAEQMMTGALELFPMDGDNPIEMVLSNDDEMAIGAVNALEKAGWNTGEEKAIPVFGIGGSAEAMSYIADGKMTGTVEVSQWQYSDAVSLTVQNLIDENGIFAKVQDIFDTDYGVQKLRISFCFTTAEGSYSVDFEGQEQIVELIGLHAGVFFSDLNDSSSMGLYNTLISYFDLNGIDYSVYSAMGDQQIQNDGIDTCLSIGTDMLVVDPADKSDSSVRAIIDKAKAADVPLVLVDTVVSESALTAYDKAVCVRTRDGEEGWAQGMMAADYIAANIKRLDRNGDGKISYVMLRGDEDDPRSLTRTNSAASTCTGRLAERNISIEYYIPEAENKYVQCAWDRNSAYYNMETILAERPMDGDNPIEAVFANSDDLALGAIDALKVVGWNDGGDKKIAVFGIDGIDEAVEAVINGTLSGTVRKSDMEASFIISSIALNIHNGEELLFDIRDHFDLADGSKTVIYGYEAVTLLD